MQTAFHLLLIEDDNLVIDSIRLLLPKNWQLTSALKAPSKTDSKLYHAAFVDMHLGDPALGAQGPGIIKEISQTSPHIEIIAMSGDRSMELMETCLANGAGKFIAKPLNPTEFIATLEKIEALWQLRNLQTRGGKSEARWIGKSAASESVRRQIAALRGESGPILIEGETGTGKEVAFRLLNQQEPNRPTITVNIASIPEALFESELFGHVKGAFTGADSNKIGLTEAAHGGDLFLDEIEALPLSQQVKLLRFLETGEIRKVGAKESTQVKTRVIVASNQKLSDLVKENKFREDLLFRISGKKIQLPPLRTRPEDVDDLAKFFLEKERARSHKEFSADAIGALRLHAWPGNVRELRRVCEQLALTSPLPVIRERDVRGLLQSGPAVSFGAGIDLSRGLTPLMDAYEAEILRSALKATDSDVERTCEILKISRSSLYQKIKNHKLGDAP